MVRILINSTNLSYISMNFFKFTLLQTTFINLTVIISPCN